MGLWWPGDHSTCRPALTPLAHSSQGKGLPVHQMQQPNKTSGFLRSAPTLMLTLKPCSPCLMNSSLDMVKDVPASNNSGAPVTPPPPPSPRADDLEELDFQTLRAEVRWKEQLLKGEGGQAVEQKRRWGQKNRVSPRRDSISGIFHTSKNRSRQRGSIPRQGQATSEGLCQKNTPTPHETNREAGSPDWGQEMGVKTEKRDMRQCHQLGWPLTLWWHRH